MDHSPKNIHPQNWALLTIYSGYRVLLSLILMVMFFITIDDPILGSKDYRLFLLTGTVYAGFALGMLVLHLLSSRSTRQGIVFTAFSADIAALILISHSSGSSESGLELLLLVTIASANMLLGLRLGILIAAMASLAVITDTSVLVLYESAPTELYMPSGLLGMAFFITAMVIQYLVQRINLAQQLAESRREDIKQLLEISQRIVQNMRTGVIVMRSDGLIRLMNQAAAELLSIDFESTPFIEYAPAKLVEIASNRNAAAKRIKLRKEGPELQVSFASLAPDQREEYLLFIDDMSKIAQHAQQLKLASLGRLTASIAHEIRNPLGAISHAAQLLSESGKAAPGDKRLTEIIENHSRRMNRIIENVLELSRRKSAQPQRFDLHEWLQEYIADFQESRGEPADIKLLASDEDYVVNVDPSQLEQVLTNIINNGLHYSKQANGHAQVILELKNSYAAAAPILDIIDRGPGIPESEREKIFEPFYSTNPQGNGLGLYICRELCESNQIYLGYTMAGGESCFRLQFSHPFRGTIPGWPADSA